MKKTQPTEIFVSRSVTRNKIIKTEEEMMRPKHVQDRISSLMNLYDLIIEIYLFVFNFTI